MATLETVTIHSLPRDAAASGMLRRAFSFPVFLGALLVAGVFISVNVKLRDAALASDGHYHYSFIEGDTWFHILVGEDILKTQAWPTPDSYSFTACGNPSMALEWLGQIGIAMIYRASRLRGLAIALLALASALLLLLYYYAWLRSGNIEAAFLASALLLPLASAFFTLRPQLVGYIFLVITLICLERFRQGRKKALWALPLLFVVWVNMHGSFVLGLAAFAVYWASGLAGFCWGGLEAGCWTKGERRQLALVFLLSLLGLAVTPYGTRLAGFTLHVILNAPLGMTFIAEYEPLSADSDLLRFFLAFLLLFLLALVVLCPSYRLEEMALLLGGVFGACVHSRLLAFFVPVFAPVLAALLARAMPRQGGAKDRCVLNAVLISLIALGLARFFPSQKELERAVACGFPRGAVEYLKRHPLRGRMFNEDFWGAYLVLSLSPEQRIFIDGRSQLYEEAGVFGDYVRIMGVDRDTPALLRKYGIEACLIERATPLATFLTSLPDWQQLYGDSRSLVLVRRRTGLPRDEQ